MLMTTDLGDLVLDQTCGTSHAAVRLAKQRCKNFN